MRGAVGAATGKPGGGGRRLSERIDAEHRRRKCAHARKLFASYDADCSGSISQSELALMAGELQLSFVGKPIPADADGNITFECFSDWWVQHGPDQRQKQRRATMFASVQSGFQTADDLPQCSKALRAAFTDGIGIVSAEVDELRSYFDFFDSRQEGSLLHDDLFRLYQHCCGDDLRKDELAKEVLRVWDIFGPDMETGVTFGELSSYFRWRDNDVLDIVGRTKLCPAVVGVKDIIWAIVEPRAADELNHKLLSTVSLIFAMISQMAVLASVVVMAVETLPEYTDADGKHGTEATMLIEWVVMIFFTAELLVRMGSCPSVRRLFANGITWIDVITVLSFYARLFGFEESSRAVTALRTLRLIRVTRALKIVRHLQGVRLMGVALRRAGVALSWLIILVILATTVSGALVFYAEREDGRFIDGKWLRRNESSYGSAGEDILFQSIPASMWWAVVTLTTVGYGDMSPVTPIGKTIAGVTMITGLLVVAYPVTILCNSFDEVYREFLEKRVERIRRRNARAGLKSPPDSPRSQRGSGWFTPRKSDDQTQPDVNQPASQQKQGPRSASWRQSVSDPGFAQVLQLLAQQHRETAAALTDVRRRMDVISQDVARLQMGVPGQVHHHSESPPPSPAPPSPPAQPTLAHECTS